MNQDISFSFIKENCKTIGDLKKRIEEREMMGVDINANRSSHNHEL